MVEVSPVSTLSPCTTTRSLSIKIGDNIALVIGAPNVLRLSSNTSYQVEHGEVFAVKELAQGYYNIYEGFVRSDMNGREYYLLESVKSERRRFGLGSSNQITLIWVPANQVRVRFKRVYD